MRFLYFYFMKDHPDRVRAVASEHAAYWRGIGLDGYLGGPFFDRSGGLIMFDGQSLEQAERLVARDPFHQQDLLQDYWVREWMVERPEVEQLERTVEMEPSDEDDHAASGHGTQGRGSDATARPRG